jgi:AdoMet-dependent rRNA methyltransferase SPB1
MGFKKKAGKNRLDKYYRLAKEQGYRSRSAFKLLQLNRKYDFLSKSRVLIDLCAAPGGWLQVASMHMPVSSMIIGVDLVPIKPLRNVVTLVEDITTDACCHSLKRELKEWKADVILHDGAPNMGTSWVQDAYLQADLVLKSLKLAVELLMSGGWFITKIFRSKDYTSLLWVLHQLFERVEATKPASSRNVSAEIFVICKGYLAPKQLDPKFLDPKYVFQELDLPHKKMDIFHPAKQERHREGYKEGDYILFKKISAQQFLDSKDPVETLSTVNQIVFDADDSRQ